MKVREIIKRLKANGWYEKNQLGSHIYFVHPNKKGKITVPNHKGDLKRKTADSIFKQAELK